MVSLTQDQNFWIFLCFGQSNMAGQAPIEEQDLMVSDRFLSMATTDGPDRQLGTWRKAVPPLCRADANISVKMREADGLLIGSPVYFASPNGTLLSLLDRLFYSDLHTDWTMKVGASVSIARRGGATTTMDVLNKYFLKTNMPVVPSQYWSIAHGTSPGEVVHDEEGMQTMRQLGLNMAFMIKSIRLGLQQFGSPKIQEELTETHYIR